MFPHKPNYMMEEYKRATAKPYGYLVVDLKPDTPEHDRLKANILPADQQKNIPQIVNRFASPIKREEKTKSYKWKPDTPT